MHACDQETTSYVPSALARVHVLYLQCARHTYFTHICKGSSHLVQPVNTCWSLLHLFLFPTLNLSSNVVDGNLARFFVTLFTKKLAECRFIAALTHCLRYYSCVCNRRLSNVAFIGQLCVLKNFTSDREQRSTP